MRVLRGVPVHMISEAAEDLNFSFVVDEEHADTLVRVSRPVGYALSAPRTYLPFLLRPLTGPSCLLARISCYGD